MKQKHLKATIVVDLTDGRQVRAFNQLTELIAQGVDGIDTTVEVVAPTAEAPKAEAPTTEAPKAEAPTTEAPKAEAPKAEAPKAEAPKAEAPTTEAPTAEAPTTEAPTAEAPTAEAPTAEAPTAEAPTAEAPTAEAPTTITLSDLRPLVAEAVAKDRPKVVDEITRLVPAGSPPLLTNVPAEDYLALVEFLKSL